MSIKGRFRWADGYIEYREVLSPPPPVWEIPILPSITGRLLDEDPDPLGPTIHTVVFQVIRYSDGTFEYVTRECYPDSMRERLERDLALGLPGPGAVLMTPGDYTLIRTKTKYPKPTHRELVYEIDEEIARERRRARFELLCDLIRDRQRGDHRRDKTIEKWLREKLEQEPE